MKAKRWTLGVVLAAAVSLVGLMEADASPFSIRILADDLGNMVHGSAAEQGEWENDTNSDDGGSSGSADSGDSNNGNNGHGNNDDGVDSSNPGQGGGGPNGADDASCPEGGECVDDESNKGKKK